MLARKSIMLEVINEEHGKGIVEGCSQAESP
jgi:hypothetical protein